MADLPFNRSKILKLARRTATKLMFSSKRLVLSTTGDGQISLVFMTSRESSCTVRLGMKSMIIRYVQAQLRESRSVLTHVIESTGGCDWKRFQWHSDCAWDAAKGSPYGPLYPEPDMGIPNICQRAN